MRCVNGKRAWRTRAELTAKLQAVFSKRSTKEWVTLLGCRRANGPINNVAQVLRGPRVKARGIRLELDHPAAGKLPSVASPMRFSGTPLEFRLAPPLLGQHTDEVLKKLLGKSDAEIAKLRAEDVL
jgi:crotonobetainyl-CoA:carnitine CoA-transferase CaiB-like acyl-CoA transferase